MERSLSSGTQYYEVCTHNADRCRCGRCRSRSPSWPAVLSPSLALPYLVCRHPIAHPRNPKRFFTRRCCTVTTLSYLHLHARPRYVSIYLPIYGVHALQTATTTIQVNRRPRGPTDDCGPSENIQYIYDWMSPTVGQTNCLGCPSHSLLVERGKRA